MLKVALSASGRIDGNVSGASTVSTVVWKATGRIRPVRRPVAGRLPSLALPAASPSEPPRALRPPREPPPAVGDACGVEVPERSRRIDSPPGLLGAHELPAQLPLPLDTGLVNNAALETLALLQLPLETGRVPLQLPLEVGRMPEAEGMVDKRDNAGDDGADGAELHLMSVMLIFGGVLTPMNASVIRNDLSTKSSVEMQGLLSPACSRCGGSATGEDGTVWPR